MAFTRLDGSTRDRGAVVERFQAADGPPVMLISLKAGGTGLNLTAADHVFLSTRGGTRRSKHQAADRAHRIGQERPVLVYRLVARTPSRSGSSRCRRRSARCSTPRSATAPPPRA